MTAASLAYRVWSYGEEDDTPLLMGLFLTLEGAIARKDLLEMAEVEGVVIETPENQIGS